MLCEEISMKLRSRILGIAAGGKAVAIINADDARELGIRALERIVLSRAGKKITAIVNTGDFVKPGSVVVYKEIKDILSLKQGSVISAEPRKELVSKAYIRKKIDGNELGYMEM